MELNEPRPELIRSPPEVLSSNSHLPVEEFPDDQENRDEHEFYKHEIDATSILALGWRFLRLVPACIGFGSEYLYVNLMTSAGLHFASREYLDPEADRLSEFSIAVFLSSMMIIAITHAIIEKATIDAALHSANNNLPLLKKVILEGFSVMLLTFFLLFLPVILLCPYWIQMLNYNAESGVRIRDYLAQLCLIQAVGQSVLYVIAITGTVVLDSWLPTLSATNLATGAGIVYWCCWHHPGGLRGWFQAYLYHQGVRVAIYLPYCVYKLKELNLSWKFVDVLNSRPLEYLCSSAWFMVGVYTEQIALEIATYLVILTGDRSQIAAQVALATMSYFIYNIGLGFSQVGRSRFGYLHERSASIKTALRFFWNFSFGMLCISVVAGYFLYHYSENLQDFFAGNKASVRLHLGSLIKLYGFTLFSDLVLNFIFCVLRCINKLSVATLANLGLIVFLQAITGSVLVLYLDKDVVWVMANFYVIQIVVIGLGLIVLIKYRKPEGINLSRGIYHNLN